MGGGKKISWVKWETVCQTKINGGLGVKDLRVMNISLLAKWQWRLLDGDMALWKDVLNAKYGLNVGSLLVGGLSGNLRLASYWWKEILKLGDFGELNWFNSEVGRRVGNGLSSSFWNDKWCGDRCFRTKYPRLYLISTQKEALVGEVLDIGMVWNFTWRRHLFMWEEEVLVTLNEDLEGVRLSNQADVWWWNLEETGVFTVKSAYLRLEGVVLGEVLWREEEKGVFDKLWKIPAPSKVAAFAWKVLLNRAPTKANLALRNVLASDAPLLCVFCNRREENVLHLFLHCDVACAVWYKLMGWLDRVFIIPPNLFIHWECWYWGG